MAYTISYHPVVKSDDIPKLDNAIKTRIKKAIETRLMVAPEEYGEPFEKRLRGTGN